MEEIIVGFIFMIIGGFISVMAWRDGGPGMVIFGLSFFAVGLFMFIRAIKKIIKDKKTDMIGEECFGIVKETKFNGETVNNVQYKDVYIYTFIPSLNTVKLMKENVGRKGDDYTPGKYVKVKYFEDDINILGFVSKEMVPQNQIAEFEKLSDIIPDYMFYTSNTSLQPMDMPSNGTTDTWDNNNNNNQN